MSAEPKVTMFEEFPYILTSEGFCLVKFVGLPEKPVRRTTSRNVVEEDDPVISNVAEGAENPPTLHLYGKIRSHDAEVSSQCYQITALPTNSVARLCEIFRGALSKVEQKEYEKADMIIHHISYANVIKFGVGDIKLPDGRVGRLLKDEKKTLEDIKIKNGDLFELDFVF